MSNGKKLAILKQVLGDFYQLKQEHLFFCPKCNHHKRKLSLNVEKNVFKCWVCDYSGNTIYRLIRQYGSYKQKHAWRELTDQVDISSFSEILFQDQEKTEDNESHITLPEEFVSLANKNLPYSALQARNYLTLRGVSKKDILFWKIGYCPKGKYSNRIIIPSFGTTGRCNYYVARTYDKSKRKYLNPPSSKNMIFNHLYLDFDAPITLVEGIFDAIISGPNSVPLLGSTLREETRLFQEIIKNDTPIFIALDADAEKKSKYLIKKLLKYDIEVQKVDVSGYSDVGEMKKDEFLNRKQKASLVSNENYLLNEMMKIKI